MYCILKKTLSELLFTFIIFLIFGNIRPSIHFNTKKESHMKKDQASSTAFSVLQGILYTAETPSFRHIVPQEVKDVGYKILSASREGRRRLSQLKSWWFKPFIPIIEKLLMPKITLHYVLRKRYIEDYVTKEIAKGTTQVINLGAGFDTLAYRNASKHPDITFIELDHPATHDAKCEALHVSENNQLNNIHFLPIDFTQQKLIDVLKDASSFDPTKKTICIVEGVLMYLNTDEINTLFNSMSSLVQNSLHIIFTAVSPSEKCTNTYGPLLKLYLKVKGEPLNWHSSPDELPNFLSPLHYELKETAGAEEFRKNYLKEYEGKLHDGEYIAVAAYHHKEN